MNLHFDLNDLKKRYKHYWRCRHCGEDFITVSNSPDEYREICPVCHTDEYVIHVDVELLS